MNKDYFWQLQYQVVSPDLKSGDFKRHILLVEHTVSSRNYIFGGHQGSSAEWPGLRAGISESHHPGIFDFLNEKKIFYRSQKYILTTISTDQVKSFFGFCLGQTLSINTLILQDWLPFLQWFYLSSQRHICKLENIFYITKFFNLPVVYWITKIGDREQLVRRWLRCNYLWWLVSG